MANIRRKETKSGVSYQITVTAGRSLNGKQIRHYKTYTPPASWSAKKQEKEAQKVALDFERSIQQGYELDNRQTFAEYAEYVIDMKTRSGAKSRTIERYRELLIRINIAIGHMKLSDIRPQHLNGFYSALAAEGVRNDGNKAHSKVDLSAEIKAQHFTLKSAGEAAGLSSSTVSIACRGKTVALETAEAISRVLNKQLDSLFTVERDTTPLSSKTILEHHRLISTVLNQAEKEMLTQYNAAAKATPPKIKQHEVNFFEIAELEAILRALESEPLKWQTITHLLLVTGVRRGELLGIRWDRIDLEKKTVTIASAILYTQKRGTYEDSTKTGNIRTLALVDETIALLKRWKLEQTAERLLCGDRWTDGGYVFTQEDGRPMHPDSVTGWLSKFSERHGLKHINPHAFRHSAASMMIYSGLDVLTVSGQLGHAKPSTTTNIYGHMFETASRAASESIANTVLRKKKTGNE